MDAFPQPPPFGTPSPAASATTPPPARGARRRIALGVCAGLAVLIGTGLAFAFLHTAEIQWTKSYDAGMTRARMESRPVLIDFSQHG